MRQQLSTSAKYYRLSLIAVILALIVVMLGAYTRLSDAGLGCPDWPGCYGKLVLPNSESQLAEAQKTFPEQIIEPQKAWKEMIHRYFATVLGLMILGLAIWAMVRRMVFNIPQSLFVPLILVAIVIFQAILGAWTVTMRLLPLVVMSHLMGGMAIAGLLWWLCLSTRSKYSSVNPVLMQLRPWAITGLILTIAQIFLGAWTSTNYAALACPHFPFCQASFFPTFDWVNAFNFIRPIGPNYEGGQLPLQASITIQMVHRYVAFLTAAYLIPFSLVLIFKNKFGALQKMGFLLLLILALQFILGVLNVELTLPLWTAVAHNGIAAVLLLTMISILYQVTKKQRRAW